jgi:uncharacterized delta-60 repeat protein
MLASRWRGASAVAAGTMCLLTGLAGAASGDLDPTFGDRGVIVLSPAVDSYALAAALQADGKLVLAGVADDVLPPPPPPSSPRPPNRDFLSIRLTRDGRLDHTYGSGGVVRTPISPGFAADGARAVAVGPDRRIVVAGFTDAVGGLDFAFARYTAGGDLDRSFSGDGVQTVDVGEIDGATGVAVQRDGKIVAAGQGGSGFTLVRLQRNGQLDRSFGNRGVVDTRLGNPGIQDDVSAVALRSGKIVAAGTADFSNPSRNAFAAARYLANGRLDRSFGTGGKVVLRGSSHGRAWALALAPEGKLVVAGSDGTGKFRLVRLQPKGKLDRSFGAGGVASTSFGRVSAMPRALALQRDGRIVVGGLALGPNVEGTDDQFAFARYNADGTADPTFGAGGKVTYDALGGRIWGAGGVIQPSADSGRAGRFVLAGQAHDRATDHVIALGLDLGTLAARPLPGCLVPRVVRMRLPPARARIRRANCSVGRIRRVSSALARGRVLRQRPAPGTRFPRGTPVHLVVSRGPG